jgi:MOSC domain-containing protein YiiM/GNAT superfamily N-acetyltransferase
MTPEALRGSVLQVNVSAGGVPKLPVERARVNRFGLEGDKHREDTVHGGPHRAVCLFAMEAIERLQAEGHPIEPGGAGENLTTTGIEWSLLPVGSTIAVGDELVLELASSTTPCATQTGNFSDGNFNRILIDRHPSDSRMYARVLREGVVQPGDPISVMAPAADSTGRDDLVLMRLDRAQSKSMLQAWRAARDAGYQIEIVEDGEIALASSHELPGPAFNQGDGLARLPNLLGMATSFFDRHGTRAWLRTSEAPWPDAVSDYTLDVFTAAPDEVTDCPPPPGTTIRRLRAGDGALFNAVTSGEATAGGVAQDGPNPWPDIYDRLAGLHGRQLLVAEQDGVPVAHASLTITGKTGWLRGVLVTPSARGRGLQRALTSARARAAAEAGCDLVGAAADPGWISARNLEQSGMRKVGTREHYIYDPQRGS